MNRIKYFCTIICVLLSLSSCIKEDLTDCPDTSLFQLKFTYEGDKNWEANDLKKATIYIFDENDQFVTSWSIESAPQLDKIYRPNINLNPGKYHFVVWFNPVSPYSVFPELDKTAVGKIRKSQAELLLNIPTKREIDESKVPFPVLLYGHHENVETDLPRENLIVIPLVQNTNTINLTVTGLSHNENTYDISITDNNGNYGFNNVIAPCDQFTYLINTKFQANANVLTASLDVLKLEATHPTPELTIYDHSANTQIFPTPGWPDNNLISLIQSANPANNFERTHEYNINLDISKDDFGNVSITMSINDWVVILYPDEHLVP
jgi:hypothetical protein